MEDKNASTQGNNEVDDVDALETPEVIIAVDPDKKPGEELKPPKKTLKQKLAKYNIYLLLFIFIIVIAVGLTVITYFQSKKEEKTATITTQTLDKAVLDQLANSDTTVGDPKQLLSVQSNAVFAGKVLVRDTLEVAGSIVVNSPITLTGLTVSGKSNLDETQVSKNLAVGGDLAVQGGLTVSKSLQVNGGGTFSGPVSAPQITTSSFQLNSDLVLTSHIIAGGPTPSRANGPALGAGGSATVNGSDTGGTVNINTGGGTSTGCYVTVNFAKRYDSTPRVLVTPVGADAGGLDFYVTRTPTSFSICDAKTPPAGASFAFDYFVVN